MTNTIYIHQPEKSVSFTRLPNFLFEAPTFTALPNEAKLLYAFILRRTELSRKNGWADEYGRIYLYYPICEVVALLHCGRQRIWNINYCVTQENLMRRCIMDRGSPTACILP